MTEYIFIVHVESHLKTAGFVPINFRNMSGAELMKSGMLCVVLNKTNFPAAKFSEINQMFRRAKNRAVIEVDYYLIEKVMGEPPEKLANRFGFRSIEASNQ
jgi:hypothetical protein